MIPNFREYIGESRLGRILDNNFNTEARKEDKQAVQLDKWYTIEEYTKKRFGEIAFKKFPKWILSETDVKTIFHYSEDMVNDDDVQMEFKYNVLYFGGGYVPINMQFSVEDIVAEMVEALRAAAGVSDYHGKMGFELDAEDYYDKSGSFADSYIRQDMARFKKVCIAYAKELEKLGTIENIEKKL